MERHSSLLPYGYLNVYRLSTIRLSRPLVDEAVQCMRASNLDNDSSLIRIPYSIVYNIDVYDNTVSLFYCYIMIIIYHAL